MSQPEVLPERTVLVDMDGVLADHETANNAFIRTQLPGVVVVENRPHFYYHETYAELPNVCSEIYAENRRPGFFRSFPIIEGALEGWGRMLDAGYVPRVCSSPLENHRSVIYEKQDWLEEHFVPTFGGWVVDTAIFDRDKSGYDACALIDDRPTVRNMERATWQHIVFSQSYNRNVETDFRLDGWRDPSLEALLARSCAQYGRQAERS